MPASNPGTSLGTPTQPVPDAQTLIALLGNLMPLLVRLQAAPSEQPVSLGQFSQFGQFGGWGAPIGPPNPLLDQQAAISFVEDVTADSLDALSTFLDQHAGREDGRYAGLDGCLPIVTQAKQCVAARDFAQAFTLIWQAYRVIAAVRAANPQLPPVHGATIVDAERSRQAKH